MTLQLHSYPMWVLESQLHYLERMRLPCQLPICFLRIKVDWLKLTTLFYKMEIMNILFYNKL